MKICIVSDSHDRGPMLAAAASRSIAEGASAVIHCGDIIGGNTLKATIDLGLPIHVIHGNNLGDPVLIARIACDSDGLLQYYGRDASLKLADRRIYLTHYPHIGHGMACSGEYDLVCCGHSHVPEIRQQPNIKGSSTFVVNPGTVAGLGAPKATWVLADLESMRFEIRELTPADL
ncbi:MAG: metallophosphoesterase family protein [Nitrospinae bacterium]|nr:metallophosphoesterase family protein [Nitrospinota bacterium]